MPGAVARNTLYLTAASVGQKLLAFGYFLAIARILGPENTGGYFIALSVVTVAQVAADLGVANVVIRSVAQQPQEAVVTIRRALAVKIPATGVAIVAALVLTRVLGHTPEVQSLVTVATAVLAADSFSLFFYAALRGAQTLRYESVGLFVGQGLTLLVGGLVLLIAPSLPNLVLALLAGSVFNAGYSASRLAYRFGAQVLMPRFDALAIGVLLREAFPFFLAAVFVKIYSYVDVQFIYVLLGQAAVGVYSIAYKFTYAFQFIPLAFSAALYPAMSALVGGDAQALARSFSRALRYMLLIAVPLAFGISAVSTQAVRITGESYAAAAPVLAVMSFALIPSFLDIPVGSLLNGGGRQSLKTALFGAAMLLNALLNWLLIPRVGMVGAAYASIASLTGLFICGYIFVPSVANAFRRVSLLDPALRIGASGLVMYAAVRILVGLLPDLGTTFLLAVSVLVAVPSYFGALWTLRGIGADDLRDVKFLLGRKHSYATNPPIDA